MVSWNIVNISWLLDDKQIMETYFIDLMLSYIIHLPFHFHFLMHLAKIGWYMIEIEKRSEKRLHDMADLFKSMTSWIWLEYNCTVYDRMAMAGKID